MTDAIHSLATPQDQDLDMEELYVLSDNMIKVLTLLGSWMAGIGALAAVITSLWLARRGEKPNLSVNVSILEFGSRPPGAYKRFVFDIINKGPGPVTVTGLSWMWREKGRAHYDHELLFYGREEDPLPRKLEPGDHVRIEGGRLDFEKKVKLLQSRKRVWAVIGTATGLVRVRVNPRLRKYLRASTTERSIAPDPSLESVPPE